MNQAALQSVFNLSLLTATLGSATPLVFVALGALISERSGVMNIGTEGMMLIGAFTGMAVAVITHSAWAGVAGAIIGGALGGFVLAVWAVTLATDQIVVGIVINLISSGITTFLYQVFFPQTGGDLLRTPPFGTWSVPLLANLPGVGQIVVANPLVYVAFVLVVVVSVFLFRTPPGLVLRAVGESARSADVAGINILQVRYAATIVGGALAGLGGSYLSLVAAHAFQPNMTAGRGFIALAAVIFGRWRPGGALIACLLFGAADAFQFRVQGLGLGIPPLSFTLLPYLVTLAALIGIVGKVIAPAEDGKPYIKEEV